MPEDNKCCRIEHAALAYGIINIIIFASLTLAALAFLLFILMINLDKSEKLYYGYVVLTGITPTIIMIIFSIILIIGVTKKKPRLVLANFIVGVIMAIVSLAGSIYLIAGMGALRGKDTDFEFEVGAGVMLGYLIYSPSLIVVFNAYKKLKAGRVYDQCNKF